MNFCDFDSIEECYSPLTLFDLGLSHFKEVKVRSESDIERELEFFEDPDYIPLPTPCSESYETEEMSSEETLSVGGSEEVRALEYGDVGVISESFGSERTGEEVAGDEVVGVDGEGEGIPLNILEIGGGGNKCYNAETDIVSEVKGYETKLGTKDSLVYLVETYDLPPSVLIRPVGVEERACSALGVH
ncbi:hypothetical protein SLA2020_325300 [Shorea laevis]